MPRDIPLSNGTLLVNFDSRYNLRDIYYPHVGKANHAHSCRSRLAVWSSGALSWLDSEREEWQLDLRYRDMTSVSVVTATNSKLGIAVTVEGAVDFHLNVFLRKIEVTNLAADEREVKVFAHHDFAIWGTIVGDTVFYHPVSGALIAYKDNFYALINAGGAGGDGLDSWTTGHKDIDEESGSWQDAEDGTLDRTPIAFGAIDCVGEMDLGRIPAGEARTVTSWMAVADSLDDERHRPTGARLRRRLGGPGAVHEHAPSLAG